MIVTSRRIYGTRLRTWDNRSAKVHDLLFDDRSWLVRNLVVRLPHIFRREDVLLTPVQIESAAWGNGELQTPLSMEAVESSPRLLSDPPVAKQGELEAARMIAWEGYWTGMFERSPTFGDPHLRNTRAVTGHRVIGLDGNVGYVDNFVIDDQGWVIRYLVARLDTHLGGRRVVIDPQLVDAISWQDRGVWVHLSEDSIEHCSEFAGS